MKSTIITDNSFKYLTKNVHIDRGLQLVSKLGSPDLNIGTTNDLC